MAWVQSLHPEGQPQRAPESRSLAEGTLHRSLWRRVHSFAEIHTVLRFTIRVFMGKKRMEARVCKGNVKTVY